MEVKAPKDQETISAGGRVGGLAHSEAPSDGYSNQTNVTAPAGRRPGLTAEAKSSQERHARWEASLLCVLRLLKLGADDVVVDCGGAHQGTQAQQAVRACTVQMRR